MIGIYLQATPWAVPLFLAAGFLLVLVAPVLGRWTGLPPWLVLAAGLAWTGFLAVTATPSEFPWVRTDLGLGEGNAVSLRVDTISWASLTEVSERSLNVWLAVPLGVTSALLAWARRSPMPLLLAALAPIAVESLQWLVPQLGRAGFLMADVSLNATGLAMGAGAGVLLLPFLHRSLRPPAPTRLPSSRPLSHASR